jgi:hypothetical protein
VEMFYGCGYTRFKMISWFKTIICQDRLGTNVKER